MDRFAAQIRIGGTIDRTTPSASDPEESVLDMMISMINGAGVSHEYGDAIAAIPVNAQDEDDSQLLQYLDDKCLQFCADQTCNGEFKELEEFLREHNIPYNRWSECYSGWVGEDVYWVPGMDKPLAIACDGHGSDYVNMEDVRQVLEGLDRTRSYHVHVESVKRQLKALCPEVPEIPPFKIVGEKA